MKMPVTGTLASTVSGLEVRRQLTCQQIALHEVAHNPFGSSGKDVGLSMMWRVLASVPDLLCAHFNVEKHVN